MQSNGLLVYSRTCCLSYQKLVEHGKLIGCELFSLLKSYFIFPYKLLDMAESCTHQSDMRFKFSNLSLGRKAREAYSEVKFVVSKLLTLYHV